MGKGILWIKYLKKFIMENPTGLESTIDTIELGFRDYIMIESIYNDHDDSISYIVKQMNMNESPDKVFTDIDFNMFKELYDNIFTPSERKRFWCVYKYLRPWKTVNQLRSVLYRTKTFGGSDPYSAQYPINDFRDYLKKNGFKFQADIGQYFDRSYLNELKLYENNYIRIMYKHELRKKVI